MLQQQNQEFCCQQNHSKQPIEYFCVNKECPQFHLYCFKCIQEGKHYGHQEQIQFIGEFLIKVEEDCNTIIKNFKKELEIVIERFHSYLKGIQQKYIISQTQFQKLTIYQKNAVLINLMKYDKNSLSQDLEYQIQQFCQTVEELNKALDLNNQIYLESDEESFCKATALYNQSYDLYKQFKFDQALEFVNQSIIHTPNNKDSLWLKGECLKMQGHYNEALIYHEKAYHQDPKCPKVLSLKAECLRLLQRYDEAINFYDEALKIWPLDASIICGKGECLKFMAKYNDAISCFDTVLIFDPNHVPSLFGKGDCLRCQKDYELALLLFEHAISQNPFHLLSKQGIGILNIFLEKCKQALNK